MATALPPIPSRPSAWRSPLSSVVPLLPAPSTWPRECIEKQLPCMLTRIYMAGYRPSELDARSGNLVSTIDGESTRGCVVAANNAMLDGFTLRQRPGRPKAGVFMQTTPRQSSKIASSRMCSHKRWRGLLTSNAPVIDRCEITSCTASDAGGGIYLIVVRRHPSRTV